MEKDAKRAEPALPEAADVASATECTGRMPALPERDGAEESLAELCGIHGAKGARGRPFQKK